jgi:outer membrane receptor protein involved in Fe transport
MNTTQGIKRTPWRWAELALAASAVFAAGAQAQQEAPVEEIVITGSRIAAPNMSSTSPVQVVSETEIRHLGKTDMVDILNTLPQVFQNSAVDFSNTSNSLSTPGGLTTVNLRGLGPQRTLVLIDGRRLGTADANTANPNPSPNIDQIPVAMIERVDVVTGGASAVYGSDAIAGVVNFIMRKDFEGVQIDAQYGFNQHDNSNGLVSGLADTAGLTLAADGNATDGENLSVSVIAGTNIADDRGNFTAYLTYRQADPINGADRDFAGCQVFTVLPNSARCGGTSNSNYFRPVTSQNEFTVVGDQFLPWPQAGSSPPGEFNANEFVNMSRDNTRYMAGFMGHVALNDHAEPYVEFGFMNDQTETVVAPSGLFRGTNPLTADTQYLVNCSNPLLSEQQRAILCTPEQVAADLANPGSTSVSVEIGRRNIEGGGRVQEFEHTNYRGVLGVRGDIGANWRYDAYGQYYYSTLYNTNLNYLNFQSIANALQATGTRDNPVCVSGGACVPYNIFTEGGVTQEQLDYLYTPGTAYGTVTQQIVHADVTGDLGAYGLTVPFAEDGISVNVGAERRTEDLTFDPDAAELSGLLAGFAGASVAIDDGYSVEEVFGEVRVPLVQNRTALYDLVFDAGYRYSDYSTAGGADTWKAQLQYAPIPDLRFRTSFQHAIRAPNIIELFSPQSYGQQSFLGVDPCAPLGGQPATATLEECIRTGVTPAQYGNGLSTNTIPQCVSNQCGQVIGGNPDLEPEQADTYSLGVTITPSALPNLTASIDYYRIELTDAVGAIPGAFLFTQCMATGDPQFCSQIVRTSLGALTGSSVASGGYILQTGVNVGEAELSGIDLQTQYTLDLGAGGHSLTASLAGTYLDEVIQTPVPGGGSFDCAGLFGTICQTINPRWRHNLRLTWLTPWDLDVSLQWRYIGGTKLDQNDSDPDLHFAFWGEFDGFNAELPDMDYFDLSAIWDVSDVFTLRAGVTNVLDEDPPIIATEISGTGSANTYPTYDTLGRQIFLSATARF